MIDVKNIKKGDVFYKAQINGMVECLVEDNKIEQFGSFSVVMPERDNKTLLISKEDYELLYYTREEAEKSQKSLPSESIEDLLEDDNWVDMMFYIYKTYMPDSYAEKMKEAVYTSTGKELNL